VSDSVCVCGTLLGLVEWGFCMLYMLWMLCDLGVIAWRRSGMVREWGFQACLGSLRGGGLVGVVWMSRLKFNSVP